MSHIRVIPRDFFNEAKLLKCLGAFELAVVDGRTGGMEVMTRYDGSPFQIIQDPGDASLYVLNYRAFIAKGELNLFTAYNSKANYPLWVSFKEETFLVFDEQGNWILNKEMESCLKS